MNKSTFALVLAATGLLLSGIAFSFPDNNDPKGYVIIALNNCKVVSKIAMTQEQFDAYQELKEQEQLMSRLQKPTKAIEQKIQKFAKRIEQFTSLAIQEDENTLHINKRYLEQQGEVTDQLNDFMNIHQRDFDALSEQAENMAAVAQKFEQSIIGTLQDINYNEIRIVKATESATGGQYCPANIIRM